MCNTTSFGDTNHVQFHLHLPWIQLSLYHHGKGQSPPGWEPKGCQKAALKYFHSPLWALGGRWIPDFLGQTGAVHTTAFLLCQIPLHHSRIPWQCSPGSSSKCCSLSCCLWLNWPILQQMRPQGEVNPSRSIKRQVRASVNSLSLAKPLSLSLTF